MENNPMRSLFFAKLASLLVLLSLFFQSCGPEPMFDNTKKIPGSVWKEDDVVRFEVPVTDTNNLFRFFLNIRHSTDYRYANVFFFIHTTFPDGTLARDTVECILADKSGKWLGRGITNIRDNQVILRSGLRFPQTGTYVFEFQQAMREEELYGIKDIGLRIIK
jgi:gliding motility-associated lipoprotein GldH